MNWLTHSKSNRSVGFIQDGSVSEGGCCPHLEDGDTAYGESSENDSHGSEAYLYCKSCYDQFLIDRELESEDCEDCCMDVPRNEGSHYIPHICEELPRESNRIFVCNICKELPAHQDRLAQDELDREAEQREAEMNNNDSHLSREDDGVDPELDDDDIDVYEDEVHFEPLEPEEGEEPDVRSADDDDEEEE